MTKTLNEAIGCWTTNLDYNCLTVLASMVKATATRCRRLTLQNTSPAVLLSELELLRKRLEATTETTNSAIKRCKEIIATNEVSK